MTVRYPKRFKLSGLIELSYRDYYYKIPGARKDVEYHTSFFEQTYGVGAGGYIYHPRLAVFTSRLTFTDIRQLASVGGGKTNSQALGYHLTITFLPYRPIALAVYAGNTDYEVSPEGNFINADWAGTHDTYSRYYGARLKIDKPNLPFMRLEYRHEEYTRFNAGRGHYKYQSDEYTLDFRGNLRFYYTRYLGLLQYVDYSSSAINYKAKYARLNLMSTLMPGVLLQNSFNYSEIDYAKFLGFSSNLSITRSELFNQYYSYYYYHSEYKFQGIQQQGIAGATTKETTNSLNGSWTYRFLNGLASSLALNYGIRNNDETTDFYGISFSTSYGRTLWNLNFSPRYRFLLRKDELRGDLMENNLELDLVTRNYRWGVLYSNYSFTISNEKIKFNRSTADEGFGFDEETFETGVTEIDRITQSLRTGIRGRGPSRRLSRAQWNVEGEIFFSDATIKRQRQDVFGEEDMFDEQPKTETIKRKLRRYSLLGNMSYPVGWVAIFFNTGYSIGESNEKKLRRFFFEERLQYPVLRNLYIYLRWKEIWEKIADNPDHRAEEYEVSAEYRIGKTTISATGTVLRTEGDGNEIYLRRLFFKLRRII